MISAVRKLIVLVILIIPGVNLRAQTDSLAIDSITNRIKEILEVYNSYSVFVDTSDYIHFHEEANNFNLQIASSLGACNEIIRFFVRGADVNTFVGRLPGRCIMQSIRVNGRQWRYCCYWEPIQTATICSGTPRWLTP